MIKLILFQRSVDWILKLNLIWNILWSRTSVKYSDLNRALVSGLFAHYWRNSSLGTNVNMPFFQVSTPYFEHGAGWFPSTGSRPWTRAFLKCIRVLVSVIGFGAINCFFLAAELTFKVTFDSTQFHTGYSRYSGIRSGNILSRQCLSQAVIHLGITFSSICIILHIILSLIL